MCVKLSFKGLNSGPAPHTPQVFNTCRVTIVPKMHNNKYIKFGSLNESSVSLTLE